MDSPPSVDLQKAVETLIQRVDRLEAEVTALRRESAAVLSPDVVLAISAAVAAYLGKRATIRQIHVSGETTWVHQGRAAHQGSHAAQYGSW